MIKGVQHRIIEIRQTDDPYFERALLFVREDYRSLSEENLQKNGEQFVKHAGTYTGLRRDRAMCWFRRAVLLLAGGFIGTLVGAIAVQFG